MTTKDYEILGVANGRNVVAVQRNITMLWLEYGAPGSGAYSLYGKPHRGSLLDGNARQGQYRLFYDERQGGGITIERDFTKDEGGITVVCAYEIETMAEAKRIAVATEMTLSDEVIAGFAPFLEWARVAGWYMDEERMRSPTVMKYLVRGGAPEQYPGRDAEVEAAEKQGYTRGERS